MEEEDELGEEENGHIEPAERDQITSRCLTVSYFRVFLKKHTSNSNSKNKTESLTYDLELDKPELDTKYSPNYQASHFH